MIFIQNKSQSTDLFDKYIALNKQKLSIWKDETLFTWQWWFGVCLIVLFVFIWIKFRKKDSTNRLLYVGFFVAIICSMLDAIGNFLGLWDYHYEVLPFAPSYVPRSLILLPILVMFFLQIKPHVHPVLKALLYAVVTAFIALPFLKWIDIYKPVHWHYIYSFFIQFFIYLGAHVLSRKTHFSSLLSEKKDT